MPPTFRSLVVTLPLATLLTGCALQTTAVSSPDSVAGTAISGAVHGGSQPIFGANVYLLAVNPTGYGGPGIAASAANASVSLLKASATGNAADSIGSFVLTDNTTGGFSLSGDYSCTSGFAQSTAAAVTLSGTEQVYLYVLGGTPQNIGTANTSSGMLVALGPCNAPSTKVVVNEITTVATAYSFAGFASDATHIGSSGTTLAIAGLNNAYADVANLASVRLGNTNVGSTSIIPPKASLTTIADILAACVNGTTANTQCGTLFQYTASSGTTGTAPTDTATAAINLAHNPWPTDAGMTALFGLVPGTGAPFTGGLTAQPTDFTLGLKITDGVLDGPRGIAIDASGNIWVGSQNSLISKFSNSGSPVTGYNGTGGSDGYNGYGYGAGLNDPQNLAIDARGYVFATNFNGNTFSQLDSNGGTVINNGLSSDGSSPYGLAFDASGNLWMANEGNNNVTEYSPGYSSGSEGIGVFKSPPDGYTNSGYFNQPLGLAIDASGHVWVAAYSGGDYISELSSNGNPVARPIYSGGGLASPYGIAIDPSGNVWVANFGSRLSEFNSSGTSISTSSGYTGGGLNQPWHLAIDSVGNVWVPNSGGTSVSEFSNAGTPLCGSNGLTGGGINQPYGVAIDGSGNVWVANYTGVHHTTNTSSITKLVGASSPVVTPVVANLLTPYGTSAVNRP
jgi:DNA-binding beta-propeller fold protein YncE